MTQFSPKAAVPYAELTDAPNIQTYAQGLATMLDSAVVPTYALLSTRDAANPSPTAGDKCYVTETDGLYVYSSVAVAWLRVNAQAGSVNVSGSSVSSVSTNVNFPEAFATAPAVMTNINSGSGSIAQWATRAISITTTGFTMFSFSTAPATFSNIPHQWVAVQYS